VATPVGHSLAGLIVALGFRRAGWAVPSLFAAVVAANVPDFDFLPGVFVGRPWAFHHGITHSIGMVVVGAVALTAGWLGFRWFRSKRGGRPLPSRRRILQTALLFAVCVASHVLIDYATMDRGAEIGIPALWPFRSDFLIAPHPIFGDVRRVPLFSWPVILHNLRNVMIELLVFGPPLALLLYSQRRREVTPE